MRGSGEAFACVRVRACACVQQIVIYDALNLQVTNQIVAHDAPIRLLAFNADGTLLASVSHKGTVVRVFSIPDGKKLFTFRRGMTRCSAAATALHDLTAWLSARLPVAGYRQSRGRGEFTVI